MTEFHKLLVEEFTTPSPLCVEPSTTVEELKDLMTTHGYRHILIENDGDIVGVVSERDLKVAAQIEGGMNLLAEDIMSIDPYTVSRTASIAEVALEMSRRKIGSAIVKDEDYLGIFTSTDALNALVEVVRGDLEEE